MSSTFRVFSSLLEGHLMQAGAGYMIDTTFLDIYKKLGAEHLKSDTFWKLHKIPFAQATYDKEYLYRILVSATAKMQHRIILKYKESRDGILAWDEFKQNFEYDGSKELRLEQLEALAQKPYNNSVPGGMAASIDQLQAFMAELEVIAPIDYSDFQMKRALLANIRQWCISPCPDLQRQ